MPYDPNNPFAWDPNETMGFGSGMGIQQAQGLDQGGAYGTDPGPQAVVSPQAAAQGSASWLPSAHDYLSWISGAQNNGHLQTPFQSLFGTRDPHIPTGNDPASVYTREMAQYMQGYTDPYGGVLSVRPEYDWQGQDPARFAQLSSTPIADRFQTNYGVLATGNNSVPDYIGADPHSEYALVDGRTGQVVFQGTGVDAARQVAMGGSNFARTQGANSQYTILSRPQGTQNWQSLGSDVTDTKAAEFLNTALPALALAIPGVGAAIAGSIGLGGAGSSVAAGLGAGAASGAASVLNGHNLSDTIRSAATSGVVAGVGNAVAGRLFGPRTPSASNMINQGVSPQDAMQRLLGNGADVSTASAALRAAGVPAATVEGLATQFTSIGFPMVGQVAAPAVTAGGLTTVAPAVVRGAAPLAQTLGSAVGGIGGLFRGLVPHAPTPRPAPNVTTVAPVTVNGQAPEPSSPAQTAGGLASLPSDVTTVSPLVINGNHPGITDNPSQGPVTSPEHIVGEPDVAAPALIGAGALAAGLNSAGPAIDPGTGLPADAVGGDPAYANTPTAATGLLGGLLGGHSLVDWLDLAGTGLGLLGGVAGGSHSGSPGRIPAGFGRNATMPPVYTAQLPAANNGLGGSGGGRTANDMSGTDWNRYAFGPERAFFSNVQQRAKGGSMAVHPRGANAVSGQGTGRSDEIPALLSDGEYVIDAETVALLGDGSNKAGAKKLDDLRVSVRKHKGRALAKGRFSVNAKQPAAYMAGGRT